MTSLRRPFYLKRKYFSEALGKSLRLDRRELGMPRGSTDVLSMRPSASWREIFGSNRRKLAVGLSGLPVVDSAAN